MTRQLYRVAQKMSTLLIPQYCWRLKQRDHYQIRPKYAVKKFLKCDWCMFYTFGMLGKVVLCGNLKYALTEGELW